MDADSKIIDQIIAVVDGKLFPNSWPNNESWCVSIALDDGDEGSVAVTQALETSEGRAGEAKLSEIHRGMQDRNSRWRLQGTPEKRRELANELDNAIASIKGQAEIMPTAVGYALGLRAGGVSIETTRTMLCAFLRNF
jgi:hypothetical protein